MKQSLLFQTDLMAQPHLLAEDHGEFTVLRTPTNPTFFGGNGLALESGLTPASLAIWEANFDKRFPSAQHRFFQWSSEVQLDAEHKAHFEAAGYDVETCAAMTTATPTLDHRTNPYLRIEPVRADPTWAELLTFWLECYPQHGFAFHARRAADFRCRKGAGDWWVARTQSGAIAGSMGLYFGRGLGRFQHVDTHPAYRRQGVCRTLMRHVLADAVENHDYETLVIAVEEGTFTQKLYASFGFETVHYEHSLMKCPD